MIRHRTPLASRNLRGLTLNEMLIVLAVFSILAIIFMFSSQTAMVKTRISRVTQEHRLIARALQTYEADTLQVPPMIDGAYRLRAPINYLSRTPHDPFRMLTGDDAEYQYFSHVTQKEKWVLVSAGPDGDSDFQTVLESLASKEGPLRADSDGQLVSLSEEDFRRLCNSLSYDPTNGSVSDGDVITRYSEQ